MARSCRRGLSYLEVLIAAGIGLAGLMGAIAVLPVAIMNMQKGVVVDTMAYIGPSALDQAKATGIVDATMWVDIATKQPVQRDTPANGYSARPEFENRIWINSVQSWDSFYIDPRFAAEVSTYDSSKHDPNRFPYVLPASNVDVRMRRVTLQNGAGGVMTTNQARLLFKLSDDLIITKPDDQTAPALVEPLMGNGTPVRRDYMGDFEWIATLTPQIAAKDTVEVSPGVYAVSSYRTEGTYSLSVVIFHQRTPLLDTITDSAGTRNTEEERLVDVEFLSNGYNGGDVLIQSRSGRPATDVDVREGQWVMLSAMNYSQPGVQTPPQNGATPIGPIFQWYKVVSVDGEAFLNGTQYRRYVTLEGPDWPVQPPDNSKSPPEQKNTTPIPSLASGVITTRMTIVSGVVGVFQTEMRLK